ncbi:endo-1,4-beta-xylanase [Alternaria panax]|uniref:Endo-1,4-beta-xylanase n=1 Tax=Alternaria panax TaxID=48097 RepID=A0AAD4IAG1_9PLEO|nr:endo-1,4-beta-xylanase [Alternaria panax]
MPAKSTAATPPSSTTNSPTSPQGTWTKGSPFFILETHFKNVTDYYWNDYRARNVVKEALNDDGTLRKIIWLELIGPEYIEHAFCLARQYTSPGTKLHCSDYGIESVIQAHFTLGKAPLHTHIRASRLLFSSPCLETALTELDFCMTLLDNTDKTAVQAAIYTNPERACVGEASCVGVTVWDSRDPVIWVPETYPVEENAYLRDEDFQRNCAYHAVADGLRKAGEKK